MNSTTMQKEHRTPEQIQADEEIALDTERFILRDVLTGQVIHEVMDEREKLSDVFQRSAFTGTDMTLQFLWNGNVYRIEQLEFTTEGGVAVVNPKCLQLESELLRRIASAPHHKLSYHQGFGFICFPEEFARYQ